MNKLLSLLLLLVVSISHLYAQCPAVATLVVGTCPNNAKILITPVSAGTTYAITAGPAGYPTASNSTGIFESLSPGTYTVQSSGTCPQTFSNLVVTSSYPAFSVTAAISNVCTGSAGGTITATVTGGNPNYTYDIVPVAGTPTYGAFTSSTTYTESPVTFGTYRVYAKDACGEIRTVDINMLPTMPLASEIWYEELKFDRPCGDPLIDGLPTAAYNLILKDENSVGINDLTVLTGATVQMYKPNPANSITGSAYTCGATLGTLLSTTTINSATISSNLYSISIVIPQEDVIFVYTDPCGHSFQYCYNFNEGNPAPAPDFTLTLNQQACSTSSWGAQQMQVDAFGFVGLSAPFTHTITKLNGTTLTYGPSNDIYIEFNQLTMDDLPATYTVVDACGRTVTKNILKIVQGAAITTTTTVWYSYKCTTSRGASGLLVKITSGDFPGIGMATATISGGTPTVIPVINPYHGYDIHGWAIGNLLPNTVYTITVINTCGASQQVTFNSGNLGGLAPLDWNMVVTRNALCGQNQSDITVNANIVDGQPATYCLTSPTITVPICNATGFFPNMGPDTYTIVATLQNPSDCPPSEIPDRAIITIPNDALGQTITRKTVFACEDINGTPLTTGKAIIDVNGAGPFIYEIIKTSLLPGGTWTLSSNNNPASTYIWDIPLAGDPTTTEYTLRSTDKCGNAITTNASLQPLVNPVLQPPGNQPCVDGSTTNYTLSLAPYATGFTYEWYKTTAPATILSTTATLTFPGLYNATNDGTYKCHVAFSGCINRDYTVVLNSGSCGQPLSCALTATATKANDLTCATPTALLTANSTPATGVTYVWSNSANTPTTTVSTANTYTVTAAETATGCTATANVTVANNIVVPACIPITIMKTK